MTEARRLSAGVIIARDVERFGDDEPLYLLLRAYRYWDFPKGSVELGETPFAAAAREVAEETGLTLLDFRWGDVHRDTPVYARDKVARYYVAVTPEAKVRLPINPELGRPEHHEYRWMPVAGARELLAERVIPILEWANGLVTGRPTPA